MSDNKAYAIVFISFFVFVCIIATADSGNTKIDIQKEKTKQLILQYKIDSLNNIKK